MPAASHEQRLSDLPVATACDQNTTPPKESERANSEITPRQRRLVFAQIQAQWTRIREQAAVWVMPVGPGADPQNAIVPGEGLEQGQHPLISLLKTAVGQGSVRLDPAGTMLQFGPGEAGGVQRLADQFARVIAVAISPRNLRDCEESFRQRGKTHVDYRLFTTPEDVGQLPPLDLFFSIGILQDFPPPVMEHLLAGLLGKLRKGGIALFQVATHQPGYTFDAASYLASPKSLGAVHCLPTADILALFKAHGCRPVEVSADEISGLIGSQFFLAVRDEIKEAPARPGPHLLSGQDGIVLARDLYRGVFGQEADPAELPAYLDVLRRGDGVAALVEEFLASEKFRSQTFADQAPGLVAAAYQGIFRREPEPPAFRRHVARLREHADVSAFLRLLSHSAELKTRLLGAPASGERAPLEDPDPVRPRTGRLVVVSSGCQTGGLAAALQALLPADTVTPLQLPLRAEVEAERLFVKKAALADAWVVYGGTYLWDRIRASKTDGEIRLVKAPKIVFPAFHPDLCIIKKRSTGGRFHYNYHSAIAAWAYNHALGPRDAAKLYRAETYAALGYFEMWNPSVAILRSNFETCGLDFSRFFLALKRQGNFMYTYNHPKAGALIETARSLANQLGAPGSVFTRTIDIPDGLTHVIWPLYPEVADVLGLPHRGYDWKIGSKWIQGLEGYLAYELQWYADQRVAVGDLELEHRDEALYDRVLGPLAGIGR